MKVHRLKTRLVNSYIIEYPQHLLVIDVAVNCHRQVLGFIEEQLGRPATDVALVCCTHDDPDHIGGVYELARLAGAEVGIPHASGRRLRKWLNDPGGPLVRFTTSVREAFRARAWQMYTNANRDRIAQQQTRYDGDYLLGTVRQTRLKHRQRIPHFPHWQLLHTPGHTWDSCCYFHAESGTLISGDTLLGSQKLGRLVAPSIYSNRRQTHATLQQLAKLNLQVVYPGHGSEQRGPNLIRNVKID